LPNAWPIRDHAQRWIFHKLQIPEAMRAWGDPAGMTLEQYIPITQNYVSRLFQLAIERMRRRKCDAGGIFHFHAIDMWPSITMSSIDFYRVPHKVYYTVQRSFQPVLASLEYDRDRCQPGEKVRVGVWAINDGWAGLPGAAIRWRVQDRAGKAYSSGEYKGRFAADSAAKWGNAVWKAASVGDYRLVAEVIDSNGAKVSENLFEFQVAAPLGAS
jgi:beta-mannosidase